MAFYSFVIYAGNGTNRNFSINFPYLDKSHVKAKINSAPTTAFSWLNDSTIQFTTAPAAGDVIEIYRETPQNSSPVDFTDGSILLERDLDMLATFNLYVGQEATDKAARSISVGPDGAFNALGLRVSNAADPVNAQDLVTKKWAENSVSSDVNQAQTAAATAVAAKNISISASNNATTVKDQAVAAKDIAVTNATEAATSAASANWAVVAAQNAKDEAVTAQTNAVAARVAAESARDTAVSAKDTAVSAKDTAVSAKDTAVQAAADAQAATPGKVKVSNTDTTLDYLNTKLTCQSPMSKLIRFTGADERLELRINLNSYATKGLNTFTGTQTMPNIEINSVSAVSLFNKTVFNDFALFGSAVTLKHNTSGNNTYLDCQASADTGSTNAGIRWADSIGTVKFKQYFTPATGVMQTSATDGTAAFHWSIQGETATYTAASLKRDASGANPNYYSFNVGDPANTTYGATVNIYGATTGSRYAKLLMLNSNTLRGGFIASDTDLLHLCTNKHTLTNFAGDPFFESWINKASLTYSGSRTNRMDWQDDGNIVLTRNGTPVWAINNNLSDARLKEDIKPLGDGVLEKVKQLNAKTYLWKDNLMGKGDKREIGLIAQEVQEVFPEVVSKVGMDDTLGIAYQNIVPVLVEAVKELSAKVEALEAQLQTKE